MQAYCCEPEALERGLFSAYTARLGAQTVLNVNFIPDLLHHIKQLLIPEELLRLEDYHLQNYLVELAIGYEGKKDLASLISSILEHMRGSNDFWYRHNNQQVIDEEQQLKHHAIRAYHRDIEALREAFKQEEQNMKTYQPNYQRKTSLSFTMRMLRPLNEPHLGTRHCLNHIVYIPPFFLSKLNKDNPQDLAERDQKEKMIRECLLYFLSNKTSTTQVSKPPSASSQNQREESSSSSESVGCAEVDKNLMQQFMEYIEKIPSVPDFHNSHHMYTLTSNLLQITNKIVNSSQHIPQTNSKPSSQTSTLEIVQLPETMRPILDILSEQPLQESQCQLLATSFIKLWKDVLSSICQQLQEKEIKKGKGWLSTSEQIEEVKQNYMQMLARPDFMELNNYKAYGADIPWKEEDYTKFLKGLAQFMNIPTNNKKIASYMGEGIESNHVKHVKGIYLTVMKERMERGECGGGKRGKSLSKADFLEKDIASFSMKWFEKSKKIKKKKPKKRRKNSQSEGFDEADSEY